MKRLPVTLTLAAWLLAACASAPWEGDAEARRAPPQQPERKEFPGVVESVREVKLDNGRVVAVTQPAGKETFAPGDRVRVLSDGHTARVTR